jgi:alginate O-acetyltransferase complex protein AlgJ
MYADKLPGYPLPPPVADRYDTALTALQSIPGVVVPDLREPLRAVRAGQPGEALYLRRDTHWTPRGAAVVAREIADDAAAVIPDDVPRTQFRTEWTGTERYAGDLLRFLPVGEWNGALGLVPEEIGQFTTEAIETSGGLFGDPVIPGALVGTSYSAGASWNFAGFLMEALELDMVNVAEEGQGPFAPMEAYLAGDTITAYPPRFVVWEIPERYLTDPPGGGDSPRSGELPARR